MGRSRVTAIAATSSLSVAGLLLGTTLLGSALLGSTPPAFAGPASDRSSPALHHAVAPEQDPAPARDAAPARHPAPERDTASERPSASERDSDTDRDTHRDTDRGSDGDSASGPGSERYSALDPAGPSTTPTPAPVPTAPPARPSSARRAPATRTSPARKPVVPVPADDRSTGCTVRTAPPPAIDHSETPKPGQPALGPLPVPAKPVGGPRMAECADILPAQAPPLPAGESSASWVLADMDTGAILAARDPHARERPASCLKILTSLVVLDRLNLDTVVEGTQQDADVDGSRVGVGARGQYTVRQLLTGLIMNSGNDAANALARQMGGVPATLAAMTAKAKELGGFDTRPTTPSGLDAQGMATSAYDLAVYYRQVMQNPEFAEISKIRLFQWPGHGTEPGFMVSSDNKMLADYPGTIGGKTGFTDDARHTRIAAAERHGRRLEVVLMRGETHPVPMDTQAARLLDYGFALPTTIPPVGQLVDKAPTDTADDDSGGSSDAAATSTDSPAEQGDRTKALLTIGGGVLAGIALSVFMARRRRPGEGGRHTVRSPD